MPPSPSAGPPAPAPLTVDDLDDLRRRLAAGQDAPPLYLLVDTALAPSGTRVQVVRVDDSSVGPEHVVVRVGADELPFSPQELTLSRPSSRRRSARTSAAPVADAVPRATPRASAVGETGQVPARPDGEAPGARASAPVGAPERAPEPAAEPVAEPAAEPAPEPAAEPGSAPGRRGRAASRTVDMGAGSARRSQRPAAMTLTMRFTGTDWTLEVTRAGRRGRAQAVSAAAVRALADRLDDVELRRALLDAVEVSRRQAAERAAALRQELSALETVLAELDE